MPKKTILFINGHLNAGGCERSLVDVLRHLDYETYEVDLLLLEGLGDYYQEIPPQVRVCLRPLDQAFGSFGVCAKRAVQERDWFSLRFRLLYLLSRYLGKGVLQHVKHLLPDLRREYDAVVAYRPGICTDFAAYVIRARRRIAWWHHGSFDGSEEQAMRIDDAYRKMDAVVAVSKSSGELVDAQFPHARGKIHVIPNMICPEELEEKASEPTELLKDHSGKLVIVSAGRMSPEKNMMLCPEVGHYLRNRGIEFFWYLLGDGQEKRTIEERIHQLGLGSYYCLTGRLKNPYPFLKAADILIHPSRVESQGITILEAMALSTPTIAVSSEGPKEYIENGRSGLLLEADAARIADTIITLAGNGQLRDTITREAKETMSRFYPNQIIPKIEQVVGKE